MLAVDIRKITFRARINPRTTAQTTARARAEYTRGDLNYATKR